MKSFRTSYGRFVQRTVNASSTLYEMSTKEAPEPIWSRPEPGARNARFSREKIAAAALEIGRKEGMQAVSMRRVAAELGAGTMTLYHYVANKRELFELMHDAMMAQLIVPEEELEHGWREAMRAIAYASLEAWRAQPLAARGDRREHGARAQRDAPLRAVAEGGGRHRPADGPADGDRLAAGRVRVRLRRGRARMCPRPSWEEKVGRVPGRRRATTSRPSSSAATSPTSRSSWAARTSRPWSGGCSASPRPTSASSAGCSGLLDGIEKEIEREAGA